MSGKNRPKFFFLQVAAVFVAVAAAAAASPGATAGACDRGIGLRRLWGTSERARGAKPTLVKNRAALMQADRSAAT